MGEARKCLWHAKWLVGEKNVKKFRSGGQNIVRRLSDVSDLRERKGQGMDMDAFEEVWTSTHEGVLQPAEVGSVSHLLREKISWIGFATDMRDHNGPVVNPFTSDILSQLDVTIAFWCRIVAPFDASVVVIVDGGSRRGIVDREATVGKVGDHVTYVDG
jgi:hypothetical protein